MRHDREGQQFDALARRLSTPGSRRAALGGVLAGVLLPLEAVARGKSKGKNPKRHGKGQDKHKGKGKGKSQKQKRTTAQAEQCWRAGACIPKKGANVSQCDLSGSTAFNGLNCTGCNVSRANLNGVDARGANFTRANLSGSCLVDADFTGAIFANNTNLYGATFCNTIMPDGSVNNSGCEQAPACCAPCLENGASCGPGIAGACCGASQCVDGACTACATCESLDKDCGSWPDGCGNTIECGATCTACQMTCPPECRACIPLVDGSLMCRDDGYTNCVACTSDAECLDPIYPYCVTGWIRRSDNWLKTIAVTCENPALTAACADLSEFLCEPDAPEPSVERAMPARRGGGILLSD